VARYIVHCIADGELYRRAMVVAGGEAWESGEELGKFRGAWLGEVNAKEVDDAAPFFVSFLLLLIWCFGGLC